MSETPISFDQFADQLTRTLAAVSESQYQRGAYGAGSDYRSHQQVADNRAAADRLTVELWRMFYDLASDVNELQS